MEYGEIISIVTEACKKCDVKLRVPLKMNARLSRTLGRVKYEQDALGPKVRVIEFNSKYFYDPSRNEEAKRQVVLHETAHYLAYLSDGQSHQHDKVFRKYCKKIGCTTTGEYAIDENDTLIENIQVQYKYDCRCSKCKNHLRYYKRMPRTIERKVSGCCHAKLDLIQLY